MTTSISSNTLVPSRDAFLRSEHDPRPLWEKVAHTIASLVRQLIYSLGMFYQRTFGANPEAAINQITWQPDSLGLVVLIHGLRSSPLAWTTQLSLLNPQARVDVFAPHVPERGMCALEHAARPIFEICAEYAEKSPGKPICLLGVSNGSRIATWLETHLRERAPRTPVRVSTIAGIHLGSSRMDQLDWLGISQWFYPDALRDELKYGSDTARNLLEHVREPLPHGCAPRAYEFYATTEDLSVPDLDSSLPLLDRDESYTVIHGHSHDSIIAAVAHQQIHSCLEWLDTL